MASEAWDAVESLVAAAGLAVLVVALLEQRKEVRRKASGMGETSTMHAVLLLLLRRWVMAHKVEAEVVECTVVAAWRRWRWIEGSWLDHQGA